MPNAHLTDRLARLLTARVALLAALAVAWLNFLLTAKWTFNGALNGPKRPYYAAALIVATLAAAFSRRVGTPVRVPGLPVLVVAGWALIGTVFFSALPISTWTQIPFYDDWPPRFQATVEGLRLLESGAVVGWQWAFLGGHHTAADLTQTLTVLGAIPMWLLGDRVGFHALHAILFIAIPLIVYLDVAADSNEDRDVTRLTAFFTLVTATGLLGTVTPSGDTNSVAGVFCAVVTLGGSRAARLGHRWGGSVMAVGLALALYSHAGFFLYTGLCLVLESIFYRDWRMTVRAAVAGGIAVVAALPLYWELLRYPDYFLTNNLLYSPADADWSRAARQVFYNTEILLHPHRWFNDYLSLTKVFLLVFVWIAVRGDRSRGVFYAWTVLAMTVLMRFDVLEVGYLLFREMHMMAAVAAPALAWFVVRQSGTRVLAWGLIAVIGLYVQTETARIPHEPDVRAFDAALVDQLAGLDGNLVLLENSPHRDLNADPDARTDRTPFGVHFEALLPEATGRRFYGQRWDSWHWSPFRGQVVAAATLGGRSIDQVPVDAFEVEMRRWGVAHLVVWTDAMKAYLATAPDRFSASWASGEWIQYDLTDADDRAVVTPSGQGRLASLDHLSGSVLLRGVNAGDPVVVRMNYYPAWTARVDGSPVTLRSEDGQLAFDAPASGDVAVELIYPRRTGLSLLALLALLAGSIGLARWPRARPGPSA